MGRRHRLNSVFIEAEVLDHAERTFNAHTRVGTDSPLKFRSLDTIAATAWRQQWLPVSERRPPHGGWDWDRVRSLEETQKGYLGLSIWTKDDRLMGLASMRCNSAAAVVRFMEADPRPHEWQRGLIGLIVARIASIYAQVKDRDQIWFWDVLTTHSQNTTAIASICTAPS
jgi:hypothetical protein